MTLEEAFRSQLISSSEVSSLVGQRVHFVMLPLGTGLPACSFMRVSTDVDHAHDRPPALAKVVIQVSSFAWDPREVKDLAGKIRRCLDGLKGSLGNLTVGAVFHKSERDVVEPDIDTEPINEQRRRLYHVLQEYEVWYTEV